MKNMIWKNGIKLILLFISVFGYAQDRPNILWLTFEDTSPQFIGCYGNEEAETPVMDKLAREGVRFSNAFSTGTVCSPSRSTIVTGVPTYKMGSGNHRSSFPIPDFIKGFPKYMRDAGYYVTNNYKTDYNIANMDAFVSDTWNESSGKAGWWNRGEGQPFFSVFNIPDSHQSRTMSMSYEWYETNVLAYLKPDETGTGHYDRELNPRRKVDWVEKKEFSGLHKKRIIADSVFTMPPFYKDSKAMRKQMARVYNSIKLTDLKMGKLLQRLKDDDLLRETIVFIFSDHGEGIPRGKTNGIGLGYRVPFIVWFPEKYKHLSPWGTGGIVTEELIDFEDLAPSILTLAGVKIPEHMKGRSFMGEERDPGKEFTYLSSDRADNGPDLVRTITDGRYVYSRNFMPFFPEVKFIRYIDIGEITQQMHTDYQAGALNEIQKSLFENKPLEVLYDLKNDPWEVRNIAGDTAYAGVMKTMRERLKNEILEEKDVHFLPEYELGIISNSTTPYEFRLKEQEFSLPEVYETANLVGKSGEDHEKRIFQRLESPNKYVRYWASLAIYAIKDQLNQKQLTKIKAGLSDNYPPVRLNLAASLYAERRDKQAETMLKQFMVGDNEYLALSAINYTLYMDDRSSFIAEIEQVYASEMGYKVKAAAEDFMELEGTLSQNKSN